MSGAERDRAAQVEGTPADATAEASGQAVPKAVSGGASPGGASPGGASPGGASPGGASPGGAAAEGGGLDEAVPNPVAPANTPSTHADAEVDGASAPDPLDSSVAIQGIGVSVRYAGRTAVGLVREHNEDNLLIADLTKGVRAPLECTCTEPIGAKGGLFAVCDGMGGAAAGEVASQMAVDTVFEVMAKGEPAADRDEFARRLVAAVEQAGDRIFQMAKADRSRRGMGTTATVAGLMDKTLFVAQVGDSRTYLLRADRCSLLTKDQSLVNQLIEAGHLTEEEAEAFEHSNIILQALGTSESVQVDLTFVELREGDRIMLCSDGLSGLVHADVIAETLRDIDDPAECSARLIELANAGGGHDNSTVIIADFTGPALEPPKETDSAGYIQYPLMPADAAPASGPPSKDQGHVASAANRPVQGRRMMWWALGFAAVVAAVALAWDGGDHGPSTAEPSDGEIVAVGTTLQPSEQRMDAMDVADEMSRVAVRVRTDVEDAVLVVNGEPRGTLSTGDGRLLELPPGAYRFEAHSAGSIAARVLVTLEPQVDEGLPQEIELTLPKGSEGTGDDARPHRKHGAEAQGEAGAALRRPPTPRDRAPATTETHRAPAGRDVTSDPNVTNKTSTGSSQTTDKRSTDEPRKSTTAPGQGGQPPPSGATKTPTGGTASDRPVIPDNPF